MTPSELKYNYECNNPDGHFFDRKTMKFFGDTMANFKVIKHDDGYTLERKKPVKHGLIKSHYFNLNFKETRG